LNQLGQVGGDVQGRLERLWSGDSGNVDASLMEPLDVPASDERWSSYPKLDKSRPICAA
jgi:hypothetical protein